MIVRFKSKGKWVSSGCDRQGWRHVTVEGHLHSGLEGILVLPFVDEDQVIRQGRTCKLSELSSNAALSKDPDTPRGTVYTTI